MECDNNEDFESNLNPDDSENGVLPLEIQIKTEEIDQADIILPIFTSLEETSDVAESSVDNFVGLLEPKKEPMEIADYFVENSGNSMKNVIF